MKISVMLLIFCNFANENTKVSFIQQKIISFKIISKIKWQLLNHSKAFVLQNI